MVAVRGEKMEAVPWKKWWTAGVRAPGTFVD
jgi:hypothetical protein